MIIFMLLSPDMKFFSMVYVAAVSLFGWNTRVQKLSTRQKERESTEHSRQKSKSDFLHVCVGEKV